MSEAPTEYLPEASEYIIQMAMQMYDTYCASVGWKNFKGDFLPPAKRFFADKKSFKQAQAWIAAAGHAYGQTPFEEVAAMNEAFGNPMGDYNQIDWDRIERQRDMLKREVKELDDAIQARDRKATVDAFGDINVFSYGGMHFLGVNGNYVMNTIYTSNMSKFCKDEAELALTKKKYDDMGVKYTVEGEFPVMFLRCAETVTVRGETYDKGKFLKGINYQPPDFDALTLAAQQKSESN